MSGEPHEGTADLRPLDTRTQACVGTGESRLSRSMLSGFSHRCRNSLNGIKLGLYLLKKRSPESLLGPWHDLEANYRAVEQYFDRLQMVYQPLTLTVVRVPLSGWLYERERDWQRILAGAGKSLVMDPPPNEVTGEFDPHHLGLALDAVVAWRARASVIGTEARLTWGAVANEFVMEWREDGCGAGMRTGESDDVVDSGCDSRAASVAVVMLNKVVERHGGVLRCVADQEFRMVLQWPTRQPGVGVAGEC